MVAPKSDLSRDDGRPECPPIPLIFSLISAWSLSPSPLTPPNPGAWGVAVILVVVLVTPGRGVVERPASASTMASE